MILKNWKKIFFPRVPPLKIVQNFENCQFLKIQTIFKGRALGKKLFFQFSKSFYFTFNFGISYGPIIMQCKDIRMLKIPKLPDFEKN